MRFFGYGKVAKTLMKLNQTKDKLLQTLIDKCRSIGTDDDPAAKAGHQAQGRKGSMIQVLMELQATEPESFPDEIVKGSWKADLPMHGGKEIRTKQHCGSGRRKVIKSRDWNLPSMPNWGETSCKEQKDLEKLVRCNNPWDDLDVAQQPYLRCIIKETLRLHPPTPLLLHHYSSEDCTMGGFRVLRRTMLLVNVWALHHDPCIWTEPEKFMPERFEGMEGTKDGLRFLPFGSGWRKYPGESLANASIALALVLQCFDWEKITS
ncbi:cytochrome P450 81C13-like [Coffea arabica]|uniref:Cytochrome P450 81C13-like n=1 Tax=Coffea arabica TaxID=13443 RepID=A0A6P6W5V3_COFAR|nr:cytochrome P450 81F4-like [Coffea arabica]